MPLVSVIMAVYNGEKYIKTSIESILNQRFSDFELIIIDDGSTDGTINVVKLFDDKRIVLLKQVNSGPVLARKKGINASKGEFVAILDADDISMPDRLGKQVDFLQRNPDYYLIGSNFIVIDSANLIKYRSRLPEKFESIKKLMYFGSQFCHSTVMFKKIVLEYADYDTNVSLAEDYNLWFKILKKYKAANLPNYLVYYRMHNTSVSNIRQEILSNASRFVIERELNSLNIWDRKEIQIHYDLFWSRLDKIYSYNDLKESFSWVKSFLKILDIRSSREKQFIQFYCFIRCIYSEHPLSGLFLFFRSGLFNPFYFRFDFFFENLVYRINTRANRR